MWPVVMVLGLVALWPAFSGPFHHDMEGVMGGRIQGAIQRDWLSHGIVDRHFRPSILPNPSASIPSPTYGNHPIGTHIMVHGFVVAFGYHEWAIRLYSLACTLAMGGAVALALRRHHSVLWAILFAALFFTLPGVRKFGVMANYEQPVVLWGTIFVLCYGRGHRGDRWWCPLLAYVVTCHDWIGGILVALTIVVRAGTTPLRHQQAWLSAVGVTLAAGTHLALLHHWEGSLGGAWLTLTRAVDQGVTLAPPSVRQFISAQGEHLHRLFGPIGLVLGMATVIAGAAQFRQRQKPLPVLTLAAVTWALCGVLNVVLFPSRSKDHEFWPYYLIPAFVFGLQSVAASVVTSRKSLRPMVTGFLFVAVVAIAALGPSPVPVEPVRNLILADTLNRYLDEDDLVCVPGDGGGPWYFYSRPWVLDLTAGIEYLTEVATWTRLQAGRRVVVVVHKDDQDAYRSWFKSLQTEPANSYDLGPYVVFAF
ncbi:MAG: hypothetical protein KDB53_00210 [Planctomycetes bacterium]|nr:hypothetical protein [Planctomycetota bacterium]